MTDLQETYQRYAVQYDGLVQEWLRSDNTELQRMYIAGSLALYSRMLSAVAIVSNNADAAPRWQSKAYQWWVESCRHDPTQPPS